ncbi:TetR/AcrR family transcriptional regulator [Cellulomonas composti]|uniref:TetR family transcriptional regulator n=1 Tax=Cellulomonas composti TaxID=266130 RepID=A0A511J8Q6_9CELL|nr:TetR/AcrR family transcriptional regulator [Cellulomonas composti]GEL94381.1 TetR family transcriptional regulator [Cellulomonas composti]
MPTAPTLTVATDDGLRERKKRARRAALIDATHTLVARDGLDAVTVEAICEAAGVSTRTFFNYFESKDDAVLGHGPWPLSPQVVGTFVAGGPTGDLVDDLETVLGEVVAHPPMGHDRFRAALELAAREPRLLAKQIAWVEAHRGAVVRLVADRLESTPQPDGGPVVEPDAVAALALVLVHTAAMRWEAAGDDTDPRDHLHAVVTQLRAIFV